MWALRLVAGAVSALVAISVLPIEGQTTHFVGTAKGAGRGFCLDPGRKTTGYTYDRTHLLTQVTEPGGLETAYAYDPDGRPRDTHERPRGGRTVRVRRGRVGPSCSSMRPASHGTPTTTPTAASTPRSTARTRRTSFAHDVAGRLLEVAPEAGGAITYQYDDAGRLLTSTDPNGSTSLGYDPVGRITSVARGDRETGYAYDDAGRTLSVAYPGGRGTVTYGYDDAGRAETITDWDARVTTTHYDASGRVASVDRPGGLSTAYSYDELGRPLTATSTRSGSTVLAQGWTYDPDGNVASVTDDTGTATFGYDDLDRLRLRRVPGRPGLRLDVRRRGQHPHRRQPVGQQDLQLRPRRPDHDSGLGGDLRRQWGPDRRRHLRRPHVHATTPSGA